MLGQFDDAETEEENAHQTANSMAASDSSKLPLVIEPFQAPRMAGHYIDEVGSSEAESDAEDLEEEDSFDSDEGPNQKLSEGLNEVMDQDWDVISGDFTKRYNRMRQHVLATHSGFTKSSSLAVSNDDPARESNNLLPATNRRKTAQIQANSKGIDGKPAIHSDKVADQLAAYSSFAGKIELAPLYPTSATSSRKGGSEKILIKDKSDRATNEQVLDPRTRLILFKMIGRELLERIDGCVSTGKEANVYHAMSPTGNHLALKIYKTSILIFKDRDRYVSGEFRFKSGYARSNPRKMVRLWAEKEMRNLRRMKTAGMRVPEAHEVRENVLVMDFLGHDEWEASPRLKDAQITEEKMTELYLEVLVILRMMFTRCKLVHADLSEYNILYHEEHLWVIDVSQSVEQDHPGAFDFLRSDIQNVNDFFARRGVATLGLTRTFQFVTADLIPGEVDEDIKRHANVLLSQIGEELNNSDSLEATRTGENPSASDEAVFAKSYIPRALDQVYDPERDVDRVLKGDGKGLIYANITGVAAIQLQKVVPSTQAEDKIEQQARNEVNEEELNHDKDLLGGSSSDESEDSGESEADEYSEKAPRGKKHEDKEEKKKRRQDTKEKAREKRSQKMSKAEKARKVKKTSGKK